MRSDITIIIKTIARGARSARALYGGSEFGSSGDRLAAMPFHLFLPRY
jgi:hypothetical protein